MMEKIRSATSRVGVKVIFGLIILSFVFAGVGGIFTIGGQDDRQYIAKVDGEGLSRAKFEHAVLAEMQSNNINDSQIAQIQALRQYVLNQQIENQLLYSFAERLGISVSNEQIKNYIRHQPIFFENKKFSNERYLSLLAANGLTPDSYADSLRLLIKQQQLFQTLFYSDFVLPIEKQFKKLLAQQRTVATASFSANDFGINNRIFNDNEIRDYYDAHPWQFTTPDDLIKLDLVRFSRSDIQKRITIANGDLKAYFDRHKEKYSEPERMAYSAIEITNEKTANAIYTQLLQGKSFAKLASEQSFYASQRKNNGFLGWFDQVTMPDLLKTVHLKRIGDFSVPLKQGDGHYVIFRLDNRRDKTIPHLEDIVNKVKTDMIGDLTDDYLQRTETEMRNLVDQGLTLSEIAKRMLVKKEHSDWLTQNNAPLTYAAVAELVLPEIGGNNNKVLGPVYVDETGHLYLMQIVGYRPTGLVAFDAVKKDIVALLQKEDREAKFQQTINQLVVQLNEGKAKRKISFSAFNIMTRNNKLDDPVGNMVFNLIPPINKNPVYGAAFLPNEQAIVASLLNVKNNAVNEQPDNEVDNILFSQWVHGTEQGVTKVLFSKAEIKMLSDIKM